MGNPVVWIVALFVLRQIGPASAHSTFPDNEALGATTSHVGSYEHSERHSKIFSIAPIVL